MIIEKQRESNKNNSTHVVPIKRRKSSSSPITIKRGGKQQVKDIKKGIPINLEKIIIVIPHADYGVSLPLIILFSEHPSSRPLSP